MLAWTLKLRDITALGPGTYALTFDAEDGTTERVECRVFEHNGVVAVRPEPDIFMAGKVDARTVTAAVLAFHRQPPPSASTQPK